MNKEINRIGLEKDKKNLAQKIVNAIDDYMTNRLGGWRSAIDHYDSEDLKVDLVEIVLGQIDE